MNPKQFLMLGGVVLVAVALLGFWGVIGPTPEQSLFGANWWFDNGENWAHLLFGVVALIAYKALDAGMQKWLAILVGLIALFFAVYGYLYPVFLGSNLENPADTLLHLAVGVWALWAAKRG